MFKYINRLFIGDDIRIEVDAIARVVGGEADNTMFGVTPDYNGFTFVGYPAVGNVQQPYLYVMSVAEFPGVDQPCGQRLLELQSFLAEHPVLGTTSNPDPGQAFFPILLIINGTQILAV